jgi:Protein of unknown function (DUF3604)
MNTQISQLLAALTLTSAVASASEPVPVASDDYPRNVLWGDTHLHSNLSTDAFGFGVTLGPEAAYRFASGHTVTSSHGLEASLAEPLDFVVLADHAESFGMMNRVKAGDTRVTGNPQVADWHRQMKSTDPADQMALRKMFLTREGRWKAFNLLDEISTPQLQLQLWQDSLKIAEKYNRPGKFTTLLGYEWSSVPGGSNLHRVVIFRDNSERAGQLPPLSSRAGDDPMQLWAHLARYETRTGGRVLAIPHNGNLSNGLMFPTRERLHGKVVDADYVRLRARWEPVVEVTQIKGDGEAHPLLSPDDEFADYETWDMGNFDGVAKTPDMLPQEYARAALRNGLSLEQQFGSNPYRFGMIGSTDSHTALATAAEDNFFGKHSGVEPNPNRWQHPVGKAAGQIVRGWQQASSGYAAVWAKENTREALWDAIWRREVYATTGSRMTVRFFGGWNFQAGDESNPDIAALGYTQGVPMGGELRACDCESPAFLVSASKDALGANLDRIQIIKGWLDAQGNTREKIYDIGWAGERKPDKDGKLPPVGTTVVVQNATWENSIGAPQLTALWRDPDFDPDQSAFYYARVIEIPTPRWTAYDSKRFDIKMADQVPMSTQERAYTSPIWYHPE